MKRELQIGKYRLLKSLGSGGFANVYLGEHVYLKTKAAIKVLHIESDLTEEDLNRFFHEARTIAQLRHPHIISIMDFDVIKDVPFLVMEYAPHGSLAEQYYDKLPLEASVILPYVKQIASALQFAHNNRVVHCDVKPENMLLNEQDKVLLSDFGIAIVFNSNLRTQQTLGTMHYMAPEQFAGKPVPASDQYALAVSIYHWLCGQFPFRGNTVDDLFRQHSAVRPRSLRELNPYILPDIDKVVLTALAKQPQQRFSSVHAFARALEEAIIPGQAAWPAPPRASSTQRQNATPPSAPAKSQPPQPKVAEVQVLLPSLFSLLPQAAPQEQEADPFAPTKLLQPGVAAPLQDANQLPPLQQVHSAPDGPSLAPPLHPLPPDQLLSMDGDATLRASQPVPFLPGSVLMQNSQGPIGPIPGMSVLTYSRHSGWVTSLAWSPGGMYIASGSWDCTVHVWDAASGNPFLTYQQHKRPVRSIAWSPDGSYIASGSLDTTVQIWEAMTGETLQPAAYPHKAAVEVVSWSPDGRHIASASDDHLVHVWGAFSKRTLQTYAGHRDQVTALSWSPDARYIASGSYDQTIQIWEAQTGLLLSTYSNHQSQVTALSWSPDARYIASGDEKGVLHLWSVSNGSILQQYWNDTGAIKAIRWSPDATQLAAAGQLVYVWGMANPLPTAPTYTYKGHSGWINALAWSPDGKYIASASDDKTVQIWIPG